MTPKMLIEEFLRGISNRFRVLIRVGWQPQFFEAASLELAISVEHFQTILDKHPDTESLETALREFLKQRWALIAHSPLAYLEYPTNPLNQLCHRIAQALAKPEEPVIKVLMPCIEVEYYYYADALMEGGPNLIELTEKEDRSLKFGEFILSEDMRSIIPLAMWFSRFDEITDKPIYNHLYKENANNEHLPLSEEAFYQDLEPQVSAPIRKNYTDVGLFRAAESEYRMLYVNYMDGFKDVPLEQADKNSLRTAVLPYSKEYLSQAELPEDRTAYPMFELTFLLKQICLECRNNGVSSRKKAGYLVNENDTESWERDEKGEVIFYEASEQSPHPDLGRKMLQFFQAWDALPETLRNEALLKSSPDNYPEHTPLESYLLIWKKGLGLPITDEEKTRVNRERLHDCVEVCASAVTRILKTHSSFFADVDRVSLSDYRQRIAVGLQSNRSIDCFERYPYSKESFQEGLKQTLKDFSGFVETERLMLDALGLCFESIPDLLLPHYEGLSPPLNLSPAQLDQHAQLLKKLMNFGLESCFKAVAKKIPIKPTWKDENGNTLFHLALRKASDCFVFLLEQIRGKVTPDELNVRDEQGKSLIDLVLEEMMRDKGQVGPFMMLVDCGFRFEDIKISETYWSGTLLGWALKGRRYDIILELMKRGALIPEKNLHTFICTAPIDCIHHLLMRKPEFANFAAHPNDPRPLYQMMIEGKLEHVKALIEAGASLNHRNKHGLRPIDTAVRNGCYDIVFLLVKSGADFRQINNIKNGSLFRQAIKDKQTELAILLLKKGASLEEVIDDEGNTVLHYAIKAGNQALIEACFERLNLDSSSSSSFSWSPLRSSDSSPRVLSLKNHKEETPLSLAVCMKDIDTIQKLHQHGVRFAPRPGQN